jgi:hypothetical protein
VSRLQPRRYEGSPDGFWMRYSVAKSEAKKRGLVFDLDPLQYRALWGQPCHYCGSKIDRIGLDRVDNAAGYTTENTVACCWVCNSWKMTFTVDEMKVHLERLYRRLVLEEALPDDDYQTPPPFRSRR